MHIFFRPCLLRPLLSGACFWLATASQAKPAETAAPAATQEQPAATPSYAAREKGRRAMSDGIAAAATRFFLEYRDSAGTQEPAFADATTLLVESLVHQDRIAEAEQALKLHQQSNTTVVEATYREALSYWRATVLARLGNKPEALQLATTLANNAQSPRYRNLAQELAGDTAAELQQWNEAELLFTQLLKEFPDAANINRARLGLVKVYLATSRNDQAAQTLLALEERPGSVAPLTLKLYRIILLVLDNNLTEALSRYQQIEAQRPQQSDRDWWMTASALAVALIGDKQYDHALVILPQAAALAPSEQDRILSRLRAAECLIALGKVELAIDALETFKNDYPEALEVIPVELHLADLLRQTKSYLTASEYYQAVARNANAPAPLRFRAAINRGWCFHDAEQYAQAAAAFADAAELGRDNNSKAQALTLAADAFSHDDNHTQAAVYYQRVANDYAEVVALAEQAHFNQAISLSKATLFAQAAEIFAAFRTRFPDSEQREEAHLQLGICLREAGEHARAVDELRDFATAFATSAKAPRALLEAYKAAMASDDVPTAITLLSTVIDNYSQTDFYAQALYQRAHVHFYRADFPKAVADSETFLDKFPLLPTATDVLIWLGDYYANRGELLISEGHFLKLVSTHPRSSQAPTALYEAAKGAYHRNDLTRAELLLQQLGNDYADAAPRVRTQAAILQGDILAEKGQYTQALSQFRIAAELAPSAAMAGAAQARAGEMHFSLGTQNDDQTQLQTARTAFTALVDDKQLPADVREMARYRLAKTLEKLGLLDLAINEYLEIVYQYDLDMKAGHIRDWYYFARSGYNAAELLLHQKQFHQAARTYERIAAAGIPTAQDAMEKARQIRIAQGLTD